MNQNPSSDGGHPPGSKEVLVTRVGIQIRQMGAQSVLTSQVIAERFNLHTTDLECLDLIYLRENPSAGDLARATGLTSGAITALIDRLEGAGYVKRVEDPTDRRRLHVQIRPTAIAPIKAVYEPMQARMFELWSSYSIKELEVILDFLSRSTALAVECTEAIRQQVSPKLPRGHVKRTTRRRTKRSP
jgi:DNA-binding MarR family transcriptional regulator